MEQLIFALVLGGLILAIAFGFIGAILSPNSAPMPNGGTAYAIGSTDSCITTGNAIEFHIVCPTKIHKSK